MSFRTVALLAACGVAAFALLDVFVVGQLGERASFWYYAIARTALLAVVAVCAAITARQFRWWKEYLGRAWTLFFAGYTLLVASEILRRFFPALPTLKEWLVAIVNIALVAAYFLIARSFRAAGLQYYGSTARKVAFITLAVVLAVALCYNSAVTELAALRAGEFRLGGLLSALADIVTFLLVAPLLLTAFALRGGQLFWIFALLTAGTFGWMVNQGAGSALGSIGWDGAIRTGRMTGFAIACCFIAAAALAQWLAAHRGTAGAASTRSTDPIATVVTRRLAPHLGPHVAGMAMKTFCKKALNIAPEAAQFSDLPKILEAMRPMLAVMLGGSHADIVIGEIRSDVGEVA